MHPYEPAATLRLMTRTRVEGLKASNDNPKPFVWTATTDAILEKVRRGRVALNQIAS